MTVKPNWLQRMFQQIAALQPVTQFFAPRMKKFDEFLYSFSDGRTTFTELLVGFPTIWVTMVGAKTGIVRTMPLVGIKDGEKYAIVASNFGQTAYPAWYYNLKTHPGVKININGFDRKFTSTQLVDSEREKYWQMAVEIYPGYESYRERAGKREIPIFLLSPDDSPDDSPEMFDNP